MSKWKKVDGYNYSISDDGRVRRIGKEKDHSVRPDQKGYLCVDLYKDGQRSTKKVHRLVAEAFIPNIDNKQQVNHKNGDKTNNSVENLEWTTPKENCRHDWKNGLAHPSYSMTGRKNPNAGRKGKPFEIIETGETFRTAMECAEKINGNHRHINDCLKGRQSTHRGYHFRYI